MRPRVRCNPRHNVLRATTQLVLFILFCICSTPLEAAFPGLRYLGDIGDLGMPGNSRTFAQLRQIRAVWTGGGVRFRGRDNAGKSWEASLPVATGAIAHTDVWQADFDRNSRADLLIAAHSASNGRCVDEVTLSFLLFNEHGQPVPWVIRTRAPYSHRSNPVPAIFSDLNHSGRAKIVVTDCIYGDPTLLGEDRSIIGIYEARDATWSLVKPARLEPYVALVRQNHRIRPRIDRLLPTNPSDWPNQGNRLDPHASPIHLTAIVSASVSCRGPVRLPPMVDGKFQKDWKDPCDELGRNRIQLSDGTVCYDWPTLVLDNQNGREIVAASEHPEALLQSIVEQRLPVVLAGQRDPNRCSPVLLWATDAR
jgi:hypothetical protein